MSLLSESFNELQKYVKVNVYHKVSDKQGASYVLLFPNNKKYFFVATESKNSESVMIPKYVVTAAIECKMSIILCFLGAYYFLRPENIIKYASTDIYRDGNISVEFDIGDVSAVPMPLPGAANAIQSILPQSPEKLKKFIMGAK